MIAGAGPPGTLYGAIARLHERGLIQELDSDGRKAYRATDRGLAVLRVQGTVPVTSERQVYFISRPGLEPGVA